MKRVLPVIGIVILCVTFFYQFFLKGLLPIPSDTIVGLYHPFRDVYAKEYSRGVPYKNFLITDPVRQQYPWRELSVTLLKQGKLPTWNPYQFSGYPLLANIQSAVFYPLNIFLLLLSFPQGWSFLIFLQPVLAGVFLYAYLRHTGIRRFASFFGVMSYIFSGFFIAWLEWGTVLHVLLWLPLILMSIDKIVLQKNRFIWQVLLGVSLISSFFAGHWQTFFYMVLFSSAYTVVFHVKKLSIREIQNSFIVPLLSAFLVTTVQWVPSLIFITQSARDVDQVGKWKEAGWFIPFEHLIQFIAPDFFGNPARGNYWGTWNYAELVGYIGIIPLIFAVYTVWYKRDTLTKFLGIAILLCFILALPTGISKLPYLFQIPFFSSSQPTRLLGIIDFSLVILAAKGIETFLQEKRSMNKVMLGFVPLFLALWVVVIQGVHTSSGQDLINWTVSKNNLVLPSVIFGMGGICLFLYHRVKNSHSQILLLGILFVITYFELMRFGLKFTPFTPREYLYPNTKILSYLQSQPKPFRIMSTDDRILPPNFSTIYRLESIEGYDPLYGQQYGSLMKAVERNKPDVSTPFGFNRIITSHNYNSPFVDLLGVKYVLSLTEISDPTFQKIFQEGETYLYENKRAFQRAFFVTHLIPVATEQEALEQMFIIQQSLKDQAVVLMSGEVDNELTQGKVEIISYNENTRVFKTTNTEEGYLVMVENCLPSCKVTVDEETQPILRTNYAFIGAFVPKGEHIIKVSH